MINSHGIPSFVPIGNLANLREELAQIHDNSLSDAEMLISMIRAVNRMGLLVGEMADNWAVVETWIKTDGVSDAVAGLLNQWVTDGTLAKILDQTALKDINKRIDEFNQTLRDEMAKMQGTVSNAIDTINKGNETMWQNVLNLINNKLNNGAITGTFATQADLKAKYPNGADGVFLALDNKHLYYWNPNNSTWEDAGSYEPNPLTDDDKQKIGDYALNVRNLIKDSAFDNGFSSFRTVGQGVTLTKATRNGDNSIHLMTTGNPQKFHGVSIDGSLNMGPWKTVLPYLPSKLTFNFVSHVTTNMVIVLHWHDSTDTLISRTLKTFKAQQDFNYNVSAIVDKIPNNIDNFAIDITSTDVIAQDFMIMNPVLRPLLNEDTNLDDSNDMIALNNWEIGAYQTNMYTTGGSLDFITKDGKRWAKFTGDGKSQFREIAFRIDLNNPLLTSLKYYGIDFSMKFYSDNTPTSHDGALTPYVHYYGASGKVYNYASTPISYKDNFLEDVHIPIYPNAVINGDEITEIHILFNESGATVPLNNIYYVRDVHIQQLTRKNSSVNEGRSLISKNTNDFSDAFTFGGLPQRISETNGVNTLVLTDDYNVKAHPAFMLPATAKYDALRWYNSTFECDLQNNDSSDIMVLVEYLDKNQIQIPNAPNKLIRLAKADYPNGTFKTTKISVLKYDCAYVKVSFYSDGGKLNAALNYPNWHLNVLEGYNDTQNTPSVKAGNSKTLILNVDKSLDTIFNSTNKALTVQSHATLIDNSVVKDLYIEFSLQGGSSVSYNKKNLKMKLFKDDTYTAKQKETLVQGAPANKKYNLKANYIDATQSLNLTVADLAIQMTQNEGTENPDIVNWSSSDVVLNAPNGGQVQGTPCILNCAEKYMGMFTLNTGKASPLFNMDDDNEKHFVIQGVDHTDATRFKTSAWTEKDFSTEQPDSLNDAQKLAVTNLLDFVVNSSDEDFKNKISEYYNLHSLGRWIIFALVFTLSDEFDKNIMHATYNGKTFNAILYDLDTSFGLSWDGKNIDNRIGNLGLTYLEGQNNLMKRFLHVFYPQVREQYWNARKTVLSNANIINTWRTMYHKFPLLELEKDGKKWNIPSVDIINEPQILHYVHDKLNYIDKEFKPETREDL